MLTAYTRRKNFKNELPVNGFTLSNVDGIIRKTLLSASFCLPICDSLRSVGKFKIFLDSTENLSVEYRNNVRIKKQRELDDLRYIEKAILLSLTLVT